MKPMARIVVASRSEDSRSKLSALLTSSGFQVFRCCCSGSELRRALGESEDCVVVMVGLMPDCMPDDLLWDYRESVQILLIARQPALDNVESPEIFRLTLPTSGQTILGALEMLNQLHRRQMPRRTGADKELVEEAKSILMKQLHITEPEAHHLLQKQAMDHGMKMTEYAGRIVKRGP